MALPYSEKVYIYGFRFPNGLIGYVGQSVEPKRRELQHRGADSPIALELRGAEMVILAETDSTQAMAVEGAIIEKYREMGECWLNTISAQGIARNPTLGDTTVVGGRVFPSKAAAARAMGKSTHKRSTIRRVLELLECGEPDAAILILRPYVEKLEAAWSSSAGKASESRARAARENGKKGGRPRKLDRLAALDALAEEAQERGEYGGARAFAQSLGIDPDNPDPECKLGTSNIGAWIKGAASIPAGARLIGHLHGESLRAYQKACEEHGAENVSMRDFMVPVPPGIDQLAVHAVHPARMVPVSLPPGVKKGSELEARQ